MIQVKIWSVNAREGKPNTDIPFLPKDWTFEGELPVSHILLLLAT